MTATDTTTEVDPYGLSSGLLDDFDAEILEAFFAADTSFTTDGTPVTVLELTLATDSLDKPSITEKFSCGANWEILDGGRSISRTQGKQQFNQQSRAGELLTYALQAGAGDVMRGRGLPFEAATWQGLAFHWERVSIKQRDDSTKERLLPTKFLGVAGAGAVMDTSGAAAATTAPAATEISKAILAKLKVAAKKVDSWDEFVEPGLEIAAGDDVVEAYVLDEANFLALKG